VPLISNKELYDIAVAIEPHILPFIKEKGSITDEEVKVLAHKYSKHKIGSERSLRKVQEYLCEL